MRQRLAIASALVGDPDVLILDEPTNGLDPNGIRWLRGLMRQQAGEGRTVLVSSHLLAEVAQAVDDVVVIAQGELRARGSLEEVLGGGDGEPVTDVRSPYPDHLRDVARAARPPASSAGRPTQDLVVPGATPEQVGIAAAEDGITLYRLARAQRSLEDTFFALTGEEAAAVTPRAASAGAPSSSRTTRTFFALTGVARSALSLLIVVLVTTLERRRSTDDDAARDCSPRDSTGLFILLLGAIGMAGEWRHRTIAGTVLSVAAAAASCSPRRSIAYAVAGVLLSLVVNVAIMVDRHADPVGARRGRRSPFGDLLDILWRNLADRGLLRRDRRLRRHAHPQPGRRDRGAARLTLRRRRTLLAGLAPDVWKLTAARRRAARRSPRSSSGRTSRTCSSPGVGAARRRSAGSACCSPPRPRRSRRATWSSLGASSSR